MPVGCRYRTEVDTGQMQWVLYTDIFSLLPTCCSAIPESAPTTTIALVLGRHQCNNKYILISVWWMKSFNETGPNCSGKLPYFCVLNGSDPSATHGVSVSAFRIYVVACLPHPYLPLCSLHFTLFLVFRAWPVDQWGRGFLHCPHFLSLTAADAPGEWLLRPVPTAPLSLFSSPGSRMLIW